jgi:hypothetical protein
MKCTQVHCHRPGLFECESCSEMRCANHAKACDECGRSYCSSYEGTCYAAHECNPPAKSPDTLLDLVDRIVRVH